MDTRTEKDWQPEDWQEAHEVIHQVIKAATLDTEKDGIHIDFGKAVFLLNVCLLALGEEAHRAEGLPESKLPMVSTIAGDTLIVKVHFESLDSRFADLADNFRETPQKRKLKRKGKK